MTKNDDWDEYFKDGKRFFKKERKIASKTDRSKYKKTDRNKHIKDGSLHQNIKKTKEDFLKGRVVSITSQGAEVDYDGSLIVCSLRGLLKKEKTREKNLVTVGDFVLFERLGEKEGLIVHVEPRFSYLSRSDNLSRRKQQLLAANIDQTLITVSVVLPPLKAPIVDRYIIASLKGGIKPVIVINKVDLLKEEKDIAFFEQFVHDYRKAGFTVIPTSMKTGEGMKELQAVMKDKASVFSGQSGVGKTSLINAMTGLNMKVGKTVEKTKKGAHTTSLTNLIPLAFGGFCVDTPGVKSFGMWNIESREIQSYFPDIWEAAQECRFPDCKHINEDDCQVINKVNSGELSLIRYSSFQFLCQSIDALHLRR